MIDIKMTKRSAITIIAAIASCIPFRCMAQSGQDETPKYQGPCKPGFNTTDDPRYEKIPFMNRPAIRGEAMQCSDNQILDYPCKNVDLHSYIPLNELTNGSFVDGNDIWGWTSPDTGIEYALFGLMTGTSFVNLADPSNPIVLGMLPTHSVRSLKRDIKTYENYAFIVSEAASHGMQIFDLTALDNATGFTEFQESAHYNRITSSHNVAINEESGYAYIVGAGRDGQGADGQENCNEGLHMVDIRDPLNPTFAGCFSAQGYTHDVQCVNYNGPDLEYLGQEICFASNEDKVDIVDVTDKANPVLLSTFRYRFATYTHQGWLTEDKHHFIINDEKVVNTRSIICDVSDLENPTLTGVYKSSTEAIDHNMYVKGNYVYQANYRAGLRVLDLTSISDGVLQEVGYFDIYPEDDSNSFNGAWSNFPFFDSGIVILSGIEQGLFVLNLNITTIDQPDPLNKPFRNFFLKIYEIFVNLISIIFRLLFGPRE